MSLNFGFGYHEKDGRWSELFQGMTDLDKQFFHNCLPFVLMGVRVGFVSEDSIPHIVAREDLNEALHRGSLARTTRAHLALVQLAAEHGVEAAARYRDALEAAAKLLQDALPEGFTPDPAKTLKRFIGFHVNVATEPTVQFLTELTKRRFDPVPHITQKEILKLQAQASKEHKAIGSGEVKHPGLEVAEPAAPAPAG